MNSSLNNFARLCNQNKVARPLWRELVVISLRARNEELGGIEPTNSLQDFQNKLAELEAECLIEGIQATEKISFLDVVKLIQDKEMNR